MSSSFESPFSLEELSTLAEMVLQEGVRGGEQFDMLDFFLCCFLTCFCCVAVCVYTGAK